MDDDETLWTPQTRRIVQATAADFQFVRHLQRKYSDQLGFIPDQGTQRYIEIGRVMLCLENDQPAGMLLGHELLAWQPAIRPITQAAIDFSAQRRAHGLALVKETTRHARESGQAAVQACCREGLDANAFWLAAGFIEVCRLEPQSTRNRQIIVWRKVTQKGFIPVWFWDPPERAGYKAKTPRVV